MTPPPLKRVDACALPAPKAIVPMIIKATAILRIRSPVRFVIQTIGDSPTFQVKESSNIEWCNPAPRRPGLVGATELAVIPGRDALRVEVDCDALRSLSLERGRRIPFD